MLEEHVTAEVGLEAGLGIRLRDGESNLAGGAEEDLAELAVANTTHARMMWMRRLWSAAAAVVRKPCGPCPDASPAWCSHCPHHHHLHAHSSFPHPCSLGPLP